MPHKKTRKKHSKHSKKKHTTSKLKVLNLFLLIFLFAFISTAISYFIMQNENSNKNITNNILNKDTQVQTTTKDELKKFQKNKLDEYFSIEESEKNEFEEYIEELNKEAIDKAEVAVSKEIKPQVTQKKKETIKVIKEKEITPPSQNAQNHFIKKDLFVYNKQDKPKIVIMLDDISTKRQKNKILDIGFKINMSFLPPTKNHSSSAKIAQDLPFHMIHFPMQASSKFKGPEINTLHVTDSYERIEKRVKQLRAWYPNAKYTNNHTGSVFTSNYEAMDKLFRALVKYNFIFVDSRTTTKSAAKKLAKKYNMPYIVRNTFIDNKKDYKYIQGQLKKAIKIAKARGYSIAIGHPHDITLKVLRESKHLLKGVEPIFVNELPYL